MRDDRGQHPGKLHVLREDRGAGGLRAAVRARHPLADIDEALRVLQLHLGRHQLLRGVRGELPEARLAPGGLVQHRAAAHRDRAGLDPPALRGGGNQHRARGGARLAQLLPGIRDRGAAARALRRSPEQVVVAARVGRRRLDDDLAPVGIELLGDERGQPGVGALAHLQVLDHDGHPAVRSDADEGVWFERAGGDSLAARPAGSRLGKYRRCREAEREAGAGLEEIAPAQVDDAESVHVSSYASALAARLMAARMAL